MGTRSITVFMSEWSGDDTIIAAIFRHWDGYPEGHGKDLANYLKDGVLVNGKGGELPDLVFNGMGRMAGYVAYCMWRDEHEPHFEIVTDNQIPASGQDYTYICRAKEHRPDEGPAFWQPKMEKENYTIEVTSYGETKFKGTPTEMLT